MPSCHPPIFPSFLSKKLFPSSRFGGRIPDKPYRRDPSHPPRQFPQELVDHIIDYCHGDSQTLRAFSLASQSCLASARHHIFCDVRLGGRTTRNGVLVPRPLLPTLNEFIDECPDVRPYIQNLIIIHHAVDFSLLISTFHKLPGLRGVFVFISSLFASPSFHYGPSPLRTFIQNPSSWSRNKLRQIRKSILPVEPPAPKPPPVQTQSQLTSHLKHLCISGFRIDSNDVPSARLLELIGTFPSIAHLKLYDVFPSLGSVLLEDHGNTDSPFSMRSPPRTRVQELSLRHKYDVPHQFLDKLLRVVDTGCLKSLNVHQQDYTEIKEIISPNLLHLTCWLTPLVPANSVMLDFSPCANLTSLELQLSVGPRRSFDSGEGPGGIRIPPNLWSDACDAVFTLPSTSSLTKLTLCVNLCISDGYHAEERLLDAIKDVHWLGALKRLQFLETVEVELTQSNPDWDISESVKEVIQSRMAGPQCPYKLSIRA